MAAACGRVKEIRRSSSRQRPQHSGEGRTAPPRRAAGGARIRQQQAEVGHRADAHKDDQRRDTGTNRHFIEPAPAPRRVAIPAPEFSIWLCTDGSASANTSLIACTSGAQFSFRGNHRQLPGVS